MVNTEYTGIIHICVENKRTRYFVCEGYPFTDSRLSRPRLEPELHEWFFDNSIEFHDFSKWMDKLLAYERLGYKVNQITLFDHELVIPNFRYLLRTQKRRSLFPTDLTMVFCTFEEADAARRMILNTTPDLAYIERLTEEQYNNEYL